jgi:hypothetical protein
VELDPHMRRADLVFEISSPSVCSVRFGGTDLSDSTIPTRDPEQFSALKLIPLLCVLGKQVVLIPM